MKLIPEKVEDEIIKLNCRLSTNLIDSLSNSGSRPQGSVPLLSKSTIGHNPNSIHPIHTTCFPKTCLYVTFLSPSWDSKWLLSMRISHQNFVCIPCFPILARYPANHSLLDFPLLTIPGNMYTSVGFEAASTSETLVNFYQATWRYNPEDSHLHVHITHYVVYNFKNKNFIISSSE
jgi:hypothetical protein